MSICLVKDSGIMSKDLTEQISSKLDIEVSSTIPAFLDKLILIQEISSSPSLKEIFGRDEEFDFLTDLNLKKCVIIYLDSDRSSPVLFDQSRMMDDSELGRMELVYYRVNIPDKLYRDKFFKMIVDELVSLFSRENPKTAFPKIPKIPNCPSIVTDDSTMPQLLNEQGLTDYPNKGDNKQIHFRNSKFKMFPFKLALDIMASNPVMWCKGGNQFGNLAFDYWIKAMRAIHNNKPIPKDSQRWIKKREGYIARHRADKRPAGVIAMIKWAGFVDGEGARANGAVDGSSLQMMLDVIGYEK